MDESAIETSIRGYIHSARERGQLPSRAEAIRAVTGELPVMPSAVAKVLTRMVEAGTLGQRADGQISLKG